MASELTELREKVAQMADALELAEVEKELAEERAQLLQDELDALKVEQQQQKAAEDAAAAAAAAAQPVDAATADPAQLLAENATLRQALVKVREICVRETDEANARADELEQRTNALQDALDESELQLEDRENEVALLKEQLDQVHAMTAHIERLTMNNAALTEENRELRAMVHGLEEYKNVSEAMEAEQNDELRRLRSANREL